MGCYQYHCHCGFCPLIQLFINSLISSLQLRWYSSQVFSVSTQAFNIVNTIFTNGDHGSLLEWGKLCRTDLFQFCLQKDPLTMVRKHGGIEKRNWGIRETLHPVVLYSHQLHPTCSHFGPIHTQTVPLTVLCFGRHHWGNYDRLTLLTLLWCWQSSASVLSAWGRKSIPPGSISGPQVCRDRDRLDIAGHGACLTS